MANKRISTEARQVLKERATSYALPLPSSLDLNVSHYDKYFWIILHRSLYVEEDLIDIVKLNYARVSLEHIHWSRNNCTMNSVLILVCNILTSSQAEPDTHIHVHLPPEDSQGGLK